jgi:hypothetical protein
MHQVLAGEVFSEEWRALVASRGGIKESHRSIASIYGTADAGVIAQETPLSALIRGWLSRHPAAARQLLGSDRLPTLAQYDPHNRWDCGLGGAKNRLNIDVITFPLSLTTSITPPSLEQIFGASLE